MIACPYAGLRSRRRLCLLPTVGGDSRWSRSRSAAEERKTVTTLFCDLVGFTAMSEAADPEDVDACSRVLRARDQGDRVPRRRRGEVHRRRRGRGLRRPRRARGRPGACRPRRAAHPRSARGPDPARPHAAAGALSASTPARRWCASTWTRLREGFLTGDAVNTAARLRRRAARGVVVGALTQRLTATPSPTRRSRRSR